ncbi:hypothetical protein KCU97_g2, partial [Aureobasidium melanogenum]
MASRSDSSSTQVPLLTTRTLTATSRRRWGRWRDEVCASPTRHRFCQTFSRKGLLGAKEGRGFSSCRLVSSSGRLESCTFSSQQIMQSPVTVEDPGIPDASGVELELPIFDSVVDVCCFGVTLTHFIAFVIRVHHTVLHTVLFDQNNKELCSKPLFEVIKERGRVIKGYSTVRVGNTVPPSLVRDENSSIAPPAM